MNQHEHRLQQMLHHMDMDTVERIADSCPAGDAAETRERMLRRLGDSGNPSAEKTVVQKASPASIRRGWIYATAAAACLVLCAGMIGTLSAGRPAMQKPEPSLESGMDDDTYHAAVQPVTEQTASTETAATPAHTETEPIETEQQVQPDATAASAIETTVQETAAPPAHVQMPSSGQAQSPASAEPVSYELGMGYSVTYTVLTDSVQLKSGNEIPAGAVSAVISLTGNTGFDGTVLMLKASQNTAVYSDAEGALLLGCETVMQHAMLSGMASADGGTLCIAGASPTVCSGDGALFTLYLKPGTQTETGTLTLLSAENTSVGAIPPIVNRIPEDTGNDYYVRWHYRAGDADDNTVSEQEKRIDTADAVYILRACEGAPNHELKVSDIDDHAETWRQYFPAARSAECGDANGNTYITPEDAAEVLHRITTLGTGRKYTGFAGTTLLDMAVKE